MKHPLTRSDTAQAQVAEPLLEPHQRPHRLAPRLGWAAIVFAGILQMSATPVQANPWSDANIRAQSNGLVVDGEAIRQQAHDHAHAHVPMRSVFRYPHQSVVVTTGASDLAFHERADQPGLLGLIPGVSNLWDWQPQESQESADLEIFEENKRLGLIRAFTLHPIEARKPNFLGDYRLGHYPKPQSSPNAEHYQPPPGFIRVTPANRSQRISDHFRLEQFLCKQSGGWPKYVAVQPALLRKLDALVRALQDRGIDLATLTVMSGYRTPYYNRAIGNVAFSRHIYGDAADIFVDRNGDGRMDDLNGDGRSDITDAKWLAAVVASLDDDEVTPGGLGTYKSNAAHGPFVHIDTRGKAARWGP